VSKARRRALILAAMALIAAGVVVAHVKYGIDLGVTRPSPEDIRVERGRDSSSVRPGR
jgi:hypothetical protein